MKWFFCLPCKAFAVPEFAAECAACGAAADLEEGIRDFYMTDMDTVSSSGLTNNENCDTIEEVNS